MSIDIVNDIKKLRKSLHSIPELALSEKKTKKMLMDYIYENTSLDVCDRDSWFYAVWHGETDENALAFRADFDAIRGEDGKPGHYCGHDGHSAILAGLAQVIDAVKPQRTVYLVFQPAEETGQGAAICIPELSKKQISEIYGFHNIPGYEKNSVIILENTFACASTGMEIVFVGKQSHAAYPEDGRNPADIISEIVIFVNEYLKEEHDGIVLGTVVGIELGSEAYGVSPGKGILRLTLRAEKENEYEALKRIITNKAKSLANSNEMQCSIRLIEEFPATVSNYICCEKVRKAAIENGLNVVTPNEPLRWSEDFGNYLKAIPGAFFGVGDGKEWPALHTSGFEFPDDIMETVLDIYKSIINY